MVLRTLLWLRSRREFLAKRWGDLLVFLGAVKDIGLVHLRNKLFRHFNHAESRILHVALT